MRPPVAKRPPPAATEPVPVPGLSDPIVRAYVFLCLASLGALLLAQVEQEAGLGGFLVLLVGLLGVVGRLHSAPLLFLLVLAAQQILRHVSYHAMRRGMSPLESLEISDVVLCAVVLGYMVGHYRLQGLLHNVVPLDPRRREGPPRWHFFRFYWLPRLALQRRSSRGVSPYEVPLLLLTFPAAALTAQLLWATLTPPWRLAILLPPPLCRFLLLIWFLGVGLLVTAAVLQHWKRLRMSPQEAALLLQDVLWVETRREQRRINRWLAWAHLRNQPPKELS